MSNFEEGQPVTNVPENEQKRLALNEEIRDLRERIQHLVQIAKVVQQVEQAEGNKSVSKTVSELGQELGGLEHQLEDTVGGSYKNTQEAKRLVQKTAKEMEEVEKRLGNAIGQAVKQEITTIGKELKDIAQKYSSL